MQCPKCRKTVNVLDTACRSCGASLSLLERSAELAGPVDSLLDQSSRLLDSELARLDDELNREWAKETTAKGSTLTGTEYKKFAALDRPGHSFLQMNGREILVTGKEDVLQIGGFVFHSPHVQTNALYRQRAGETSLVFLADEPTVNAFATDHRHPGLDIEPPFIVLFGGLANAGRLASLALACNQVGGQANSRARLQRTIRRVGEAIVSGSGRLDREQTNTIFEECGLAEPTANSEILRRAYSYSAAVHLTVIAHELGHIALGHTLGMKKVPEEISRNQEREADSFAASVTLASPFSDYTVAGGIFWWIILTWAAAAAGTPGATSHPHARERLMDYIRANHDQAVALGFDEKSILSFLP